MKQRIITGVCMAAVFIPIVIFSEYIVYPIAVSLLCVMAMFELFRVIGMLRCLPLSIPAFVFGAFFPLYAFFVSDEAEYLKNVLAAVFVYLLYAFAVAVFMRGKINFSSVSAAVISVLYLTVSFTAMSALRYADGGEYYVYLIFISAWVCDIFAYFTGRLFGRHKLIVEISPKKTVEGAVGGIVFVAGAFALYGFIVGRIYSLVPNYPVLVAAGVVAAVISQIGDLIASLIKREHEVKDYSNIFPGHGGVMDRFDSVLAVAPVVFAGTQLTGYISFFI